VPRTARNPRSQLTGEVGRIGLAGPDEVHGWGRHRWHTDDVRLFPDAFPDYDDVPRLFREHILPGHAPEAPLLVEGDNVVTLGSCFAQELREVLELARFGSNSFWVPSGLNNTYALLDFVSWTVTGSATHRAYRYERGEGGEIGEWRPGDDRETFERHFREAGAFVFTIGLAEVWTDRENGRVFWRGVPEHVYDAGRHEFRLTTVAENEENLREIVRLIHSVNPRAPIVLTLSPVPLLATFRDQSCMTADCVSKSVLRVALDNVMAARPENVYYWPSFELVRWAGSALDWRAWGIDARHAHRYLVQVIVNQFVESFYGPALAARLRADAHQLSPPHRVRGRLRDTARLVGRARRRLARARGLSAAGAGRGAAGASPRTR
jgi:hypothetical protein